jgi:Fe-S cluster assembly scaffold protein SufB
MWHFQGQTVTLFLARFLSTLMMGRRYIPPQHRFLQEPHGATSQNAAFVRWSNGRVATAHVLCRFKNEPEMAGRFETVLTMVYNTQITGFMAFVHLPEF